MYLVDTSVWIDYLREKDNQQVQYLIDILNKGLPFGITSIIYQEILQGARSKQDFNYLADYFSTQRFFHPKDELLSYQAAADIAFTCRTKGITLRSLIDCLIAQVAIEHDLTLIHNDKDYIQINKVFSNLKLVG